MAINYHKYSIKRKAIMQQVRRLEKKNYIVDIKYHMPKVRDLRKMSLAEQKDIIKRATGFTVTGVNKSAYRYVDRKNKAGKVKQVKEKYKPRLRKNKKKFYEGRPYEPPHIGDLMKRKILDVLDRYAMYNSKIGVRVRGWLNDADANGLIDRLSGFSEDMLLDFDRDIAYLSIGRIPRGTGIQALHLALTNKGFPAEEWQNVEDDMNDDIGASRFDEESFYRS